MVEQALRRPLDDEALSRAFAALADPIRRDIVARLTADDATVNELAEPYDISLQAVSKHLKVLESSGLVTRRRDAQRRPVHLEAGVFDQMTAWIERYRRAAEERYRRLDELLRQMPDAPASKTKPARRQQGDRDDQHDVRHEDHRRRARPDDPNRARVRRSLRESVPRPHRP